MAETKPQTMALEHTPGPWKVERGDFNPAFGGILAEVKVPSKYGAGRSRQFSYDRVAIKAYDVQHRNEPPAFAAGEANARLIAAAPDLLEAALSLLEFWDNGTPVHPGAEVVADLRAAAAKAAKSAANLRAAVAKATKSPTPSTED
jgi:hypothetical protein